MFFYIIQAEEGDDFEIEFKFENESLLHALNNKTMRTNMFQVSHITLTPISLAMDRPCPWKQTQD